MTRERRVANTINAYLMTGNFRPDPNINFNILLFEKFNEFISVLFWKLDQNVKETRQNLAHIHTSYDPYDIKFTSTSQ